MSFGTQYFAEISDFEAKNCVSNIFILLSWI